jgi:glutamate dehydrogenase/leucine dehydrogenase
MRASVFEVLRAEELNRLRIHHDWRRGTFSLYAAREWDPDTSFAKYNTAFTAGTLVPSRGRYLDDAEARAAFDRHGMTPHLERIQELMRKGRHILLDCYDHAAKDIRFVNHIHSDRRGVNNRRSSLVMGGIRRHEPDEAEIDVFIDGMNLGRGMTFKNVAAGLPMGGCKTTVQMKPVDLEDLDQVGFLAFATDRTRNTAGPDMGFPPELADVVNEHYSLHFVGGPKGPLGPTGTPTAHGVHMAVQQGAKFLWGSESLAGKTIAVQGLGAVGFPLASAYLAEGARLIVCDRDAATIGRFVTAHQGAVVRVVSPDEILRAEAEIFSPAAGGGILTEDNIPTLRFKLIMGGANNVLTASSQEEEIELAEQLAERGILYQIDWWHNIAGVMAGYEEYVLQREAALGRLLEKVGRRCADSTWENLNAARREQITPTERAYRVAEREVYGEQEPTR